MWTLVPLGNPGDAYTATRHNLGRLMLMRWMQAHAPAPGVARRLPSGTLYRLTEAFQALVPGTYMNLSGQACAEAAAAGCAPERMVLLYDDKDLPLGLGRFRLEGSDGGHNGLRSVCTGLGTSEVARLRLGIGPFQRPLVDWVLEPWTEPEWEVIARLDAPFARFLALLNEAEDLAGLANAVNPTGFWAPDEGLG